APLIFLDDHPREALLSAARFELWGLLGVSVLSLAALVLPLLGGKRAAPGSPGVVSRRAGRTPGGPPCSPAAPSSSPPPPWAPVWPSPRARPRRPTGSTSPSSACADAATRSFRASPPRRTSR